jgi:hypothetical protein
MNWPPGLYAVIASLFFGLVPLGLGLDEYNRFITKEYFELGWDAYEGPDLDFPEHLYGVVMLLVASTSSVICLLGRKSITLIEVSGVKRLAVKRVLRSSLGLTDLRISLTYLLIGSILTLLLALVILFMGGSLSIQETFVFWLLLSLLNGGLGIRIGRRLSRFQTGVEYAETLKALRDAVPESADPKMKTKVHSKLQLQSLRQWWCKILRLWTTSKLDNPSSMRIALHVMIVAQQILCCLVATYWVVTELAYPPRYVLLMLLPTCIFIGFVCTQIVLPERDLYAACSGFSAPVLALLMCFIADRALLFFFTSLFLSQLLGFSLLVSIALFKDSPIMGKPLLFSIAGCGLVAYLLGALLTPDMIKIVFGDYSGLLVVLAISVFIGLGVFIQKVAGEAVQAILSLLWMAVLLMAIQAIYVDFDWRWSELLVLSLLTLLTTVTYPHITSKYCDFWFDQEAKLFGVTERIREAFSPSGY